MFCLPAMKLMFIIFKWSHFYILNKGMFAERTKRLEANNVTERLSVEFYYPILCLSTFSKYSKIKVKSCFLKVLT